MSLQMGKQGDAGTPIIGRKGQEPGKDCLESTFTSYLQQYFKEKISFWDVHLGFGQELYPPLSFLSLQLADGRSWTFHYSQSYEPIPRNRFFLYMGTYSVASVSLENSNTSP